VHETQVPLLQTLSVPQTAPFERFALLSTQLMVGTQAVKPAWQGLAGTQGSPAVQETQEPPLHTRFVPQVVPLGALPDCKQTGAPVSQAVVPVRQGWFGTWQLAPAAQSTQVPALLQILSVPQAVPALTRVPLSMQTGAPVVQERPPLWQGLVGGVQGASFWQVAHWPAWQTMPEPQEVPLGLLSDSVQTGAPVVQAMVPVRQGFPVTVQSIPAAQETQLPPLQTLSAPHTVPLAWGRCVSLQVAVPLPSHTVSPT
jgi:hypothetical protein